MKSLLFLRHAKSSWSAPDLDDHERPLNGRGRRAAAAMGRYIEQNGLLPDLILCSTATRAQETLKRASAAWSKVPPIKVDGGLYNFSSGAGYLDLIHQADDDLGALMLVGHNPTIEMLVSELMGRAEPELAEKLARKYPSGALARLQFDVTSWRDIKRGEGHLVDFTLPRELED